MNGQKKKIVAKPRRKSEALEIVPWSKTALPVELPVEIVPKDRLVRKGQAPAPIMDADVEVSTVDSDVTVILSITVQLSDH